MPCGGSENTFADSLAIKYPVKHGALSQANFFDRIHAVFFQRKWGEHLTDGYSVSSYIRKTESGKHGFEI
jgi:hypothetical protein